MQARRPLYSWYTKEFHRLGAINNFPKTEQQLTSRFILGLRDDIKEVVKLHPVAYLVDAITLLTTIEESVKSKQPKNISKATALGSTITYPS